MGTTTKFSFPMGNLVWGNVEVNVSLAKPEEETTKLTTIHKVIMQELAPLSGVQAPAEKTIITHEDEKIALILFLAGGFTI